MSNKYIPTTWVGSKTVATANVMNNMEKGISDAHDRLDGVDEQFNTKANKDEVNYKNYIGFGEIDLPSDFPIKLPFSLYRKRDGLIYHNYNLSQFENYSKILYVDSVTGNDSYDGNSSTPFSSLKNALRVASTLSESEILIKVKGDMFRGFGGVDDGASAITTITNKKISIIADDLVTVANAQTSETPKNNKLSWVLENGIYKTTRTNTYNIFDRKNRDVFGVAKPLKYVNSIELCRNTLNSWYTDNNNVYVNTFNKRVPDNDLLVCINVGNFWVNLVNSKLYIKNLEFYSGHMGDAIKQYGSCFISGDINSEVILNECKFAGGEGRPLGLKDDGITQRQALVNALQVLYCKSVYSFNCVSAYARRDGFNYHYYGFSDENRKKCLAFEYNCIAYECGIIDENQNNNAFTCHEGINVLRVGNIGYKTNGPVCADVNGCYSLMYDCSMRDSVAPNTAQSCSSYNFDDSYETNYKGKAVLINCEGEGINSKYSINCPTGFDLNLRNYRGAKIREGINMTYI